MVLSERAVYRERTPWPGWVQIMLWGTLSLAALGALAGLGGSDSDPRAAVGVIALGGIIHWFFGGLSVRLYRDRLVVGLGSATLLRSSVPYNEIVAVEAVRYSPLRDFGGWGFRIKGNKRAWTSRGNDAVVLSVRDGREIYIGTETPDRLRERILTIGGARVGRASGSGSEGTGKRG